MSKWNNRKNTGDQKGFTLIELMIYVCISSIVLTAVYTVFKGQQKTYTNQQGVVDMQENLRAGMYYLTREVRLAGYEAQGVASVAGIVQAGPGKFHFTMDIFDDVDDDGDGIIENDPDEIGFNDDLVDNPGEEIIYALVNDADEDGFPDSLTAWGTPQPAVLARTDVFGAGTADALMENVEAIAFAYAFDKDNDGKVEFTDLNGNGQRDAGEPIIWAIDTDNDKWLDTILDTNTDGNIDTSDTLGGAVLASTDRVNVDSIRMVRIWMLVRSPIRDNTFRDQGTYVVGNKRLVVDDSYRRRLLAASVVCRNMGG